ncbi:MAG: hypothetical protein GY841_00880, partial [FCB group bacterium]|nr:hypothetical protein [FCB group bacterium]
MRSIIRIFPILSIAIICLMPVSGAQADNLAVEFTTLGSTVDNLLSDSTELADAYATSVLKLDFYPISSLELSLNGEHSQYSKIVGLTSNYGDIGLTFIPLNPKSSFSFYLSGHLNGRKYHNDFSLFDNNSGDILAAIGYRPTARLLLRTGASFTSTAYINSEIPYKRDLEFFAGTHISLPASNSLDIEAGLARSNYEYIDAMGRLTDDMTFFDSLRILSQPPDSADNVGEKLKSFYYSIRLSRPLPLKSGLSLVYTNRIFQNDDHNIVYGFTTG